jgi:hypothetical protein
MSKLLTKEEIFKNPEISIKWLCYDVYITIDNQVFSLLKRKLKEQLIVVLIVSFVMENIEQRNG